VMTGNSSVLEFVNTRVSAALPPALRTVQVTISAAEEGTSTVANCRLGTEPTRNGRPQVCRYTDAPQHELGGVIRDRHRDHGLTSADRLA
jgi:hypothetical protein